MRRSSEWTTGRLPSTDAAPMSPLGYVPYIWLGDLCLTVTTEKVELVKDIIVNLTKDVGRHDKIGHVDSWTALPVERFLQPSQQNPEVIAAEMNM